MKDVIEKIAKGAISNNFTSFLAKVVAVNGDNTCDVDPVGDATTIFDVRFRAKLGTVAGFYAKPKEGSFVVVTMLNKSTGFISLYSDVDEVYCQVDGEDNGGAAKVEPIFQRLKAIETALKNLNSLLVSHVHPSSGAVSPTLAVLPDPGTTTKSDLENTKFKH